MVRGCTKKDKYQVCVNIFCCITSLLSSTLLFPSLYLLCSPNIHRFQTCWQCPQKETFFWQPTLNWAFTNRWGVIDWRYQPGVGCSRLDARNEIISIASAGSVELWRSGSMGYLQGIESERADWMRHALKLNLPINQRTIYPASRWLPLVFRLHLLEGLNKKESVNFFWSQVFILVLLTFLGMITSPKNDLSLASVFVSANPSFS